MSEFIYQLFDLKFTLMKKTIPFFFIAALVLYINTGCKKNPPQKEPIISTPILDTFTVAGGYDFGNAPNQLKYPAGIFVDANNNLFIADSYNQRIQKWAAGADSGTTVAGGNGYGNASNQLTIPLGIFVDASGNIFIADRDNDRIQKWAPGADSGTTVAGGNGAGAGPNQLVAPQAVYIGPDKSLYVSDPGNGRIIKFPAGSTSATSGTTVAGGNGLGTALNQLSTPEGLSVDSVGNLFVADAYNYRVLKFPAGSTSSTYGSIVAGGNGRGNSANQLNFPLGITLDADGNIYIADYFNARVQKWAMGATTGTTVAGNPTSGIAYNQLSFPYDVFLDAGAHNLFISDYNNYRVQEWKLK
jgi:sugar lactone lactonase YvrE